MSVKRISLKDLGREIDGFGKATLEKQKKAVVLGITKSLPMLAEKSPVDTGAYAASWSFTEYETKCVLGNYAPHAPIIEYGARPFTPPIAPLLAWAKRVLQDSSQPPNYSSHVWALAKYTQAKIAREGMKPRLILTDAMPDIIKNIESELRRIK